MFKNLNIKKILKSTSNMSVYGSHLNMTNFFNIHNIIDIKIDSI